MDVSTTFRNLVSNQFMPEFDYIFTQFSFSTVFYKTHYSYCCCECAFQHEYMDYITKAGTLDELIYNKVVSCIEDGQCPHVTDFSPDYICKSSVNAIHIAAAVGTVEAVKYHVVLDELRYLTTGIFRLESCIIAALKRSYMCLEIYFDDRYTSFIGFKMSYGHRSKKNTGIVKIKRKSLLVYCVKKKDIRLLKFVLRPYITHSDIHRAYELSFKLSLFDMQEAMLNYDRDYLEYKMKCLDFFYVKKGPSCAIPAIVCNQPEVLDRVLQLAPAYKLNRAFRELLTGVCLVLERNACYDILLKHDVHNGLAELNTQKEVKHLLYLYTFYKEFRQEIFSILMRKKNISQVINTPIRESNISSHVYLRMNPLHIYIDENSSSLDVQVVKAMLELGADVDVTDIYGNTALRRLVHEKWWFCEGFREVLELLIQQNPSQYMNRSLVDTALRQDKYMKARKMDFTNLPGKCTLDGKLHSLFGHDDANSSALNYTVPMLIECGFLCSENTLMEALENASDPAEQDYLKKCLNEPRSLKLNCRDVLRKTFCGRQLRKFLDVAFIPNRIKNYILLKSTLVINEQSS